MPWFVNKEHSENQSSQNAMVCEHFLKFQNVFFSLKIMLIIYYYIYNGKPAKSVNNVKFPPFSSGIWKRCSPRASETALGLRPWAVLKALGRPLFQKPMKKGGVLAQNNLALISASLWVLGKDITDQVYVRELLPNRVHLMNHPFLYNKVDFSVRQWDKNFHYPMEQEILL